jgi:hypothetical protein
VKKEDILKEAVETCAKIGDWEKYCELSIELNEWERAIMAAPYVSVSYWKEILKKYSDYCNKNESINEETKLFTNLLAGNYQPALKSFMENNDYEDAKVIWVTRNLDTNNDTGKDKIFMI